jgi:hypothetical protein
MCIGTSATMSSAHDELERAIAVARVGKLIFGEELSAASIIDENLARATDPRINRSTLGEALKNAVLAQTPAALLDKELFSHPLACWIETEIGLLEGEKLRRRLPMTMSEAGAKLSSRTGVNEMRCKSALAGMLSLMGRREGPSDRAFLAFKLHRFISGAGHAYATLESVVNRRVVLEGQVFHPADPNARLYPIRPSTTSTGSISMPKLRNAATTALLFTCRSFSLMRALYRTQPASIAGAYCAVVSRVATSCSFFQIAYIAYVSSLQYSRSAAAIAARSFELVSGATIFHHCSDAVPPS